MPTKVEAKKVRKKYRQKLMKIPKVSLVRILEIEVDGEKTGEYYIGLFTEVEIDEDKLKNEGILPSNLDGVEIRLIKDPLTDKIIPHD